MKRLRSYDAAPPGSYPYEQTEGIRHSFPSVPVIEAQAKIVADFRAGNKLPRASVLEALEDIDRFTCARLGGHSAYCVDTGGHEVALAQSHPIISPCRGCGANLLTV